MHSTQQQPTGPNLFKPSLLAWRANYLATKAEGSSTPTAKPGVHRRVLKARLRRPGTMR
jgi:hypothetical protein